MIYNVNSQQTVNIVKEMPTKSEISRIRCSTIPRPNYVFISDVFKKKL